MKSTKKDWLHFTTGFAVGILMTLAVSDAAGATHQDIVATTLILEAGGEYSEGAMEAVHEVIYNRSIKRNKSMSDVCLQKWQFSCWNGKDIDQNIIKAKKHPRWSKAMKIVNTAEMTNYTHGADHYYADYIKPPYWEKSLTRTTQIGRHIFFK
jgi:spore germination cell wall hydrolase CwlJ-like protein